MGSISKVYFFRDNVEFTLAHRTELKLFIEGIFKKEGKRLGGINYIFCTDRRLLEINRQYLKHDYYTDIITFSLATEKSPVEGEIYISIDRVRDNARELQTAFSKELLRVIFHGALHLCGYNDKTKAQQNVMREKEDLYLAKFAAKRST